MKARLLSTRDLAPGVRHFEFDLPSLEKFGFVPGQFMSLTAGIGDDEITRAYSIASPPSGNRFALCLNEVEGGRFSPHLFTLKSGDEVSCQGPFGAFIFKRPISDSLLVATGTGIAPFRSMLLDRLPQERERQFTLVFGVRHEHGLLYREEWEALARQHPNFDFRPTLTRPGTEWTGRTGRVQGHVLEALADHRELDIYICGLKEMVNDVRALLKERGMDRKRIVYERYD
jgi:CDP-4-dehydro-6-deoxyglucose reductase